MTYEKSLETLILEIMKPGVPIAPSELVAHVKRGSYAPQFINQMKQMGYSISTVKQGRSVVSYTLNSAEPAQLDIISSLDEDDVRQPRKEWDKGTYIDPDWDKFDYDNLKSSI